MPTTIPEMTLARISDKGMRLEGFLGISAEIALGAGGLFIQMFATGSPDGASACENACSFVSPKQ